MVPMILCAGQQRSRRHKEQTFGHSRGRRGWLIWENSIETYTFPYAKQIASGSLLYDSGNPKPVLCDNLERQDGEGCEIHADIWQKPSQYCKIIIL